MVDTLTFHLAFPILPTALLVLIFLLAIHVDFCFTFQSLISYDWQYSSKHLYFFPLSPTPKRVTRIQPHPAALWSVEHCWHQHP